MFLSLINLVFATENSINLTRDTEISYVTPKEYFFDRENLSILHSSVVAIRKCGQYLDSVWHYVTSFNCYLLLLKLKSFDPKSEEGEKVDTVIALIEDFSIFFDNNFRFINYEALLKLLDVCENINSLKDKPKQDNFEYLNDIINILEKWQSFYEKFKKICDGYKLLEKDLNSVNIDLIRDNKLLFEWINFESKFPVIGSITSIKDMRDKLNNLIEINEKVNKNK